VFLIVFIVTIITISNARASSPRSSLKIPGSLGPLVAGLSNDADESRPTVSGAETHLERR
jgi:hypothetical protein